MRTILLVMLVSISWSAYSQTSYDTLPNLPDHYQTRLAKFKKEPIVTGKILFAGDDGWNWRKLLKDSSVINRGISGDNTFGLLQRVDEVSKHKPSTVFLQIGINDLSKNVPVDRIVENIFSIVHGIHTRSPKTKVYVQSLLPVNPSIQTFPKEYARQESIREINDQLKKYGNVVKYTYVNTYSEFVLKGTDLDPRYTKDGVHLNAAGYLRWLELMKKSGYL